MSNVGWFSGMGAVLALSALCAMSAPHWAQPMMWKVWLVLAVAALIRAFIPRKASANDVDQDERAFFRRHRGRHSDESMLGYLNDKRARIGMPRRPGKNADIVQALQNGSKR